MSRRLRKQAGAASVATAGDGTSQTWPDVGGQDNLETKCTHITPVGGNVFVDLGFDPREAAALKMESERRISERLAIKDILMIELAGWVEMNMLEPAEAAVILGVTRFRVSEILERKANRFTIDTLVSMLIRIGKHVHVSVR